MDIKRGIEKIQTDLDHLFHRVGLLPSFRWAYVTAINPVRIRYDGEADPVAGVPDVLVTELMVGDRVFCIRLFGRDIVLGRGKGGMRRVALKSHLDAWSAPDGTIAYVSSENRHYVRSSGAWQIALEDTDWLPLTPLHPRFTVGDYAEYRRANGFITIRFRNITTSTAGTENLFDLSTVGFVPGKTIRCPVAIDGSTVANPAWINGSGVLRSNWMTGQKYWMEHTFKL